MDGTELILVVDANRFERYALMQLLLSARYRVQVATNAEEALAALLERKYRAVIVDMTLASSDGYNCLKQIRLLDDRDHSSTVVIGLKFESDLSLDVDRLIQHPMTPESILQALSFLPG